jgi:gliding motility-associated-like protein
MIWSWRIPVWLFFGAVGSLWLTERFSISALSVASSPIPTPLSDPISVSGQYTSNQLVRDIFARGVCNNISNISAIGSGAGIGYFENGTSSIGLEKGIILSTGPIAHAVGPNNLTDKSGDFNYIGGDSDLNLLANTTVRDRVGLEFDFVPLDSFVTFRYVFASEEYCEFVGSDYNDVFGFFISGPGIQGTFSNDSRNIALIPGSNDFVAINTVNHLHNAGQFIRNELPADALQCGMVPQSSPFTPLIQYDGFTRRLTARLQLIPCETYHLRMVVADVGDNFYDSAVFLEAESFNIGGAVAIGGQSQSNTSGIAYEGCNDGHFRFQRADPSSRELPITVRYSVVTSASTAIEGIDFAPLPGIATIPAGQTAVQVPVSFFNDQITEGVERLVIELNIPCACYTDTATLYVTDAPPLFVQLPDAGICRDAPARLQPSATQGRAPYSYYWSNGATSPVIEVLSPTPVQYSVTVTDACGSSASDTAWVQIAEPPDAWISGEAEICAGDTAFLPVVLNGVPPWALTYTIDGVQQAIISDIQTPVFELPATLQGTYRIAFVEDAFCRNEGQGSAQVQVNSIEIQWEVLAVSCFGFSDGSLQAILSGGSPPYSTLWSTGAENQLAVQNLRAGIYSITVSDAVGCWQSAAVEVPSPEPVGPVTFRCEDLLTPGYAFSAVGGRPPYRYGVFGQATSDASLFRRLVEGQRYDLIIEDAAGCRLEQNWIMPSLRARAAEIASPLKVRAGTATQLETVLLIPESLIASIRWIPEDGLDCSHCLRPILTAFNSNQYTLRIIDIFGCSSETTVDVQVEDAVEVFIPSAFSPNEDRVNDRLVVYANPLLVRKVLSFKVFDRWGGWVYQAADFLPNDEDSGWNGTFLGQLLQPGVYTYVAQVESVNGTAYTFSGDVLLLR